MAKTGDAAGHVAGKATLITGAARGQGRDVPPAGTALEESHQVIPDCRLGEGEPITEFGRSSGVNTLPLAWEVRTS